MLYYLLLFVIFLLVAQFAIALLPFLLPMFLIMFVFSLFKRPNVKVYTQTYTFDDQSAHGAHKSRSLEPEQIPLRKPIDNSIDVEYCEHEETGETQ